MTGQPETPVAGGDTQQLQGASGQSQGGRDRGNRGAPPPPPQGTPETLAAALAELQQHLPRIGKDSAAVMPGKDGGRPWGYKYANLAAVSREILPMLGKLGLSFTARPTLATNDKFVLIYKLLHAPSGEFEMGAYPLPQSGTPQQIGSAITYARRYCLLAVTGAAPDDDDDDDDDAQTAEQAVRAQRNAPPEIRADGSATEAELTRMNQGPEPGAWRSDSTAENDSWYDQPPDSENQPGSSLREQRQGIYIALGKRGIKDHKTAIERLIDRDITAPQDMSHNEAIMVRARIGTWDGRTDRLLSPLIARKDQASAQD